MNRASAFLAQVVILILSACSETTEKERPESVTVCGTCIGVACCAASGGCRPPEVLYSDPTVRFMDASCSQYPLPSTVPVLQASVTVEAGTSGASSAYVYLQDGAGEIVGTLNVTPAGYSAVSGTQVFNPAIAVASVQICSWWNEAWLLHLDFYGDPGSCSPTQ